MPDPRQLALLAIALAVPMTCYILGRTRAILAWVGFTLCVQVFDTSLLTNLPAPRLVGLLYLPVLLLTFRDWSRIAPARAWLINFGYMVLLGVLFGYLFPWPDITGVRPFSLRAQGRTIIYLTRTLADLSLVVFVMRMVADGGFETLRRWMVRGAVATSAFGMLSMVSGIDFYLLITSLRGYGSFDFRARGLSFEPRGLGLACAIGIVLVLARRRRTWRDWAALLTIGAGLVISSSSSGFACTLVGLAVIALLGSMRARVAMAGAVAAIVLVVIALVSIAPTLAERSRGAILSRLAGRGMLEANPTHSAAERFALRLDVFDASALLFLIRNPVYSIIGTGPGLMSLPASYHVPEGLYSEVWHPGRGIDNPPSHGVLAEIANSGVIGFLAFVFQIMVCSAAFRRLRRQPVSPVPADVGRTLFLAGAAIYAVQVGPSPYWAVFLGIGWSAPYVLMRLRHRHPAPAEIVGIPTIPRLQEHAQ